MDIFESLENLDVSEECFESIINIVEEYISEDTISYIKQKYGEPRYYKNKVEDKKYANIESGDFDDRELKVPLKSSKSAQLINKFLKAKYGEEEDTSQRRDFGAINGITHEKRYTDKNKTGEQKTEEHRWKYRPDVYLGDQYKTKRHKGPRQRFGQEPIIGSGKKTAEQAIQASKERHQVKIDKMKNNN